MGEVCIAQNIKQADSLLTLGNYSKAIAIYESAEHPNLHYDKIAKAYFALGNYGAALSYYQKLVEAKPEDALNRFNYAKLLFQTKNYQLSSKHFQQLIAKDSTNPNYHYQLGLVLEATKDSMAFKSFHKAYQLDETHQKAIYKIARQLLKTRQFSQAHQYIDKGLEAYVNNIKLIGLKAQCFYYQENYKQAQEWFLKLLDLGETSEFIYEKLSLCYANNSYFKEAIEYRKKALEYNPKDANALFVVGVYYNYLQDYENAQKYMEQALELKDKPLDAEYRQLSSVYNQLKKYDKSIEALKKAIKDAPDNLSLHFFLLSAKDRYYADIDTKIRLYENFIKRFPNEKVFLHLANRRLKELKETKFLSESD